MKCLTWFIQAVIPIGDDSHRFDLSPTVVGAGGRGLVASILTSCFGPGAQAWVQPVHPNFTCEFCTLLQLRKNMRFYLRTSQL